MITNAQDNEMIEYTMKEAKKRLDVLDIEFKKNNQRDKSIGGLIMNAFEIGLSIGMIALIYITYEILKIDNMGADNRGF